VVIVIKVSGTIRIHMLECEVHIGMDLSSHATHTYGGRGHDYDIYTSLHITHRCSETRNIPRHLTIHITYKYIDIKKKIYIYIYIHMQI